MAEGWQRVQHEEHHKHEEEDLVADVKGREIIQNLLSPTV